MAELVTPEKEVIPPKWAAARQFLLVAARVQREASDRA